MKSEELRALIGGFLAGNSREFRAIHARISQYVYHQRFGSNRDKDDVISETILALVNCLREDRFRGDSIQALSVFIYMTVRNQIATHLKKQWRTAEDWNEFSELKDSAKSPDALVEDCSLAAQIYASLDPECRELLWHKFHLHWSDQEIADQQKKTKNAVSTAICRCLKRARELELIKNLRNK